MSKSLVCWLAMALMIALATLVALHQTVTAIPSLTAHRHDAPHVTWSAAAIPPGDPNSIAHQHRSERDFDNAGDAADTGGPYDANKVWDNRNLHINAVSSFDKGHGFIEAPNQPRYCIQAGVPANAAARIVDAFNVWEGIGADGGLRWGLDFQRVDPCPADFIEIRVTWGDTTAAGQTSSTEGQINDCGPPAGDQPCRVWMRFNETLSWDFNVNPAGVGSSDFHFYTTALHEAGHAVGSAEQGDNTDVMYSDQGAGCLQNLGDPGVGPCFGAIDADSIELARDLYSIPQPTPTDTPTPTPTSTPTPTPTPPPGVGGVGVNHQMVIDCDGYYAGATSLTLTLDTNVVTTFPLSLNCSPGGQARQTFKAPSNWNDLKLVYWCDVTKPTTPPPPPLLNTLDVPPSVQLDKWYALSCPSTGTTHGPDDGDPGEPRIQVDLLPVGGIAEAPDVDASALGATASGGSSSPPYGAIAGAAAGGALLLAAGGLWARRRRRAG